MIKRLIYNYTLAFPYIKIIKTNNALKVVFLGECDAFKTRIINQFMDIQLKMNAQWVSKYVNIPEFDDN